MESSTVKYKYRIGHNIQCQGCIFKSGR